MFSPLKRCKEVSKNRLQLFRATSIQSLSELAVFGDSANIENCFQVIPVDLLLQTSLELQQ
jgi:hypothetical protein